MGVTCMRGTRWFGGGAGGGLYVAFKLVDFT